MDERFIRNEILYGDDYKDICNNKVAIFGLGGVGGYVVESLARFGIKKFILVDGDDFSLSNINRQILATEETVGLSKAEVAKKRILSINPKAEVEMYPIFFTTEEQIDLTKCDIIIDAIDTVTSKLSLIEIAYRKDITIISAMGCGNKTDPSKLKITDIKKTSVCPLCKVMRRELKNLGIEKLTVVYSDEEPKKISLGEENGRHPPSSSPFVPSVAGILLANEAVKILKDKIRKISG